MSNSARYIVNGPMKLSGEVDPIGNKNSVLKLIPASILFEGDYVLKNVPAISDVAVLCEILEAMGAEIEYRKEEGYLRINTDNINTHEIPAVLAKKLRASIVLVGPLLARFGKVKATFPGGDKIGVRELTAHFASLMQIGFHLENSSGWDDEFVMSGAAHGADVYLYEPSVTATENVILAAALNPELTRVIGAACEPHVQELCLWLQANGVEIEGIGSNIIRIRGKQGRLSAAGKEHEIWPDHLDVAGMVAAAAITDSSLKINNVREQDLVTIKYFYEQLGVRFRVENGDLYIDAGQEMKIKDPIWARIKGVYSQPWYGFPSDLMSMTIALALFVEGTITFTEKLYPDRMSFTGAFEAAGASVIYCDPRRIVVQGPNKLKPFHYQTPDIRAGMGYLLAALGTEGVSAISGVEHIERGYPDILSRFQKLGANVEKIDDVA